MTEEIDEPEIAIKALEITRELGKEALSKEHRFPSEIQAVLVFSGPGTYFEKLKPGEENWERWMDRDRIRAGVAVVREITAAKIREEGIDRGKKGHYVSPQEIIEMGPYLIYNGTPIENEAFLLALSGEYSKLPKEKVILINQVTEDDGSVHPIRNTADQYKSIYQELKNENSPIHGISNIALVAHVPDFIRHPFYAKLIQEKDPELKFWAYALHDRPGTEKEHIQSELRKLREYAKKGDLATDPVILEIPSH
jgi:hypothetical protein